MNNIKKGIVNKSDFFIQEVVMEKVKIIPYEEKYNGQIAECMVESADDWGGYTTMKTAEDVASRIKTMDYEEIFLAILDERLIGFCTLEKFWADREVLYIGLINVTPEFHGKKIGKKLLLKAIEKSVELGKDELDLYTWAGNTKAVPLYKKCGFFWEKRDRNIRLMNYIPFIRNNELIKKYIDDFDWYEDFQREIKIKPDGRENGEFEFYDYEWKRGDKKLKLIFERRGHGLTEIDCKDFRIKMELEGKRAIVSKKSIVKFKITNKKEEPLNIKIKGINDSMVTFNYSNSFEIKSKENIEAELEFEVTDFLKINNDTKRIPGICAEVTVEGKSVEFRKGVYPLNPIKIDLISDEEEKYEESKQKLHLQVESNLNYRTKFYIELPEIFNFETENKNTEVELDPFEKKCISIDGFLKKSAIINGFIKYHEEGKEDKKFKEKVIRGFHTYRHTYRENDNLQNSIKLIAGRFSADYSKSRNFIELTKNGDYFEGESAFFPPKIGKPYSKELEALEPSNIEVKNEDEETYMEISYEPHEKKGIIIRNKIYLDKSGIAKRRIIVENKSNDTLKNLWIADPFFHDMNFAYVPYKDAIMYINSGFEYPNIAYNDLTENWIFSLGKGYGRGLCWERGFKVELNGFLLSLHHDVGNLATGEKWESPFVYISMGTYDLKEFRKFALKNSNPPDLNIFNEMELLINEGNPIINKSLDIMIRKESTGKFEGSAKISSKNNSFNDAEISKKEKKNIEIKKTGIIDEIKTVFYDKNYRTYQRKVYPIAGNTKIKYLELPDGSKEINNGKIQIRASEKFPNALYSLKYNGYEWLETSYPEPKPFSWWNPWTGGISNYSGDVRQSIFMKEKFSIEHITKKDNYGNEWEGLSLNTEIKDNEKYTGLTIKQNFFLLPGVELLSIHTEIINHSGKLLLNYDNISSCFLHTGENFKNYWFKTSDELGNTMKYLTGNKEHMINSKGKITVGSKERKEKINIFTNDSKTILVGYSNILTLDIEFEQRTTVENGEKKSLIPVFFLFSKKNLKIKRLSEIRKIRFE